MISRICKILSRRHRSPIPVVAVVIVVVVVIIVVVDVVTRVDRIFPGMASNRFLCIVVKNEKVIFSSETFSDLN